MCVMKICGCSSLVDRQLPLLASYVIKWCCTIHSRVVPFTASYSQSGDKGSDVYFKYIQLQDKVVTKADYEQAREKWLKEKKESNEKVQKELANHVK